jgi:hypothetical protein
MRRGKQFQNKGGPGEIPDIWNLIHPKKVLEVAKLCGSGSKIIFNKYIELNKSVF